MGDSHISKSRCGNPRLSSGFLEEAFEGFKAVWVEFFGGVVAEERDGLLIVHGGAVGAGL